jgi:hypothetical protein
MIVRARSCPPSTLLTAPVRALDLFLPGIRRAAVAESGGPPLWEPRDEAGPTAGSPQDYEAAGPAGLEFGRVRPGDLCSLPLISAELVTQGGMVRLET